MKTTIDLPDDLVTAIAPPEMATAGAPDGLTRAAVVGVRAAATWTIVRLGDHWPGRMAVFGPAGDVGGSFERPLTLGCRARSSPGPTRRHHSADPGTTFLASGRQDAHLSWIGPTAPDAQAGMISTTAL